MTTNRTFVLDTSVLLSDPSALFNFDEHDVVIPIVAIKELEGKRHDALLGFNARTALRHLESLRNIEGCDLRKGVAVNALGGSVRIEINHVDTSHLPDALRNDGSNDTRILSVADALAREGLNVTVVSKDLPLRLLAHGALGINAEEYRSEQVGDSSYTGLIEVEVTTTDIDTLFEQRVHDLEIDAPINTGVVLLSPTSSALGRVTKDKKIALVKGDLDAFGVHGRSAEQRIALDHLLNNEIGLVSLGGPAGTGKSVLALAAALELVLERREMQRIIVFRPVIPVAGQDLGYLPGTEEEKMSPWTAAVFDALRAITNDNVIEEIRSRGTLEILPLTHIRGRSIRDAVCILDECQNLEGGAILSAVTRMADNSRMFLLHDVAQRDNLHVGRHDGIAASVEKLKGEPLFAHVTLTRSERSPIAALASRLLDGGAG